MRSISHKTIIKRSSNLAKEVSRCSRASSFVVSNIYVSFPSYHFLCLSHGTNCIMKHAKTHSSGQKSEQFPLLLCGRWYRALFDRAHAATPLPHFVRRCPSNLHRFNLDDNTSKTSTRNVAPSRHSLLFPVPHIEPIASIYTANRAIEKDNVSSK